MSHFDVVCFRFPYVLQRISYCHIGSMVFVVPPTPPPPLLLLPNKQRTSNFKSTEPYSMHSFMRLSYLTVTRYPVAQAIIITGPLNKPY